MPSLAVSNPTISEEKPKKDKKMMKNIEFLQSMEIDEKKQKKVTKRSIQNSDSESDEVVKKESEKKDKKKRKAVEIEKEDNEDEENKSDTSSEMGEPVNTNTTTKKAKLTAADEEKKIEDPNSVSNFRISKPLVEALKTKGIEALFPIQAMTFNTILDGFDLIGRARTGQVIFVCYPDIVHLHS